MWLMHYSFEKYIFFTIDFNLFLATVFVVFVASFPCWCPPEAIFAYFMLCLFLYLEIELYTFPWFGISWSL